MRGRPRPRRESVAEGAAPSAAERQMASRFRLGISEEEPLVRRQHGAAAVTACVPAIPTQTMNRRIGSFVRSVRVLMADSPFPCWCPFAVAPCAPSWADSAGLVRRVNTQMGGQKKTIARRSHRGVLSAHTNVPPMSQCPPNVQGGAGWPQDAPRAEGNGHKKLKKTQKKGNTEPTPFHLGSLGMFLAFFAAIVLTPDRRDHQRHGRTASSPTTFCASGSQPSDHRPGSMSNVRISLCETRHIRLHVYHKPFDIQQDLSPDGYTVTAPSRKTAGPEAPPHLAHRADDGWGAAS